MLLAEYQSAGRGRRGRAWLAPPGGAVCLSLSWTFREVPRDLGALGLVIGVCALRALHEHGLAGASLKWPNDVLIGEKKLGGVLIELRAESAGPACVVIGIGLNVCLGATLLQRIAESGTAATDLASVGISASRNAVAASLISACIHGLTAFEREGLKPFIEEWRTADALRGRPVNVSAAAGNAARHRARHRHARRARRRDPAGRTPLHLGRRHGEGLMALLLVDIGNTRIKWARLSGDRLGRSRAAVHSAGARTTTPGACLAPRAPSAYWSRASPPPP